MTTPEIKRDALNRAFRTLVQGLGIDLAVAVAMVLGTTIIGWSSWGDVQWSVLSFTLAKTATQAVVAYIMRRWANRSLPNTLQAPEV